MRETRPFQGRREDGRFLTGAGRYTADWSMPGELHAAFRRSDVAHARLARIDTARAAGAPGVAAVLTACDFSPGSFGLIRPPISYAGRDGRSILVPSRPLLAQERVRFVGEEIAVVLAGSSAAALDAAERIEVNYEELPAAVGVEAAVRYGAPLVHDDIPGNICFECDYGDEAATRRLLDQAPVRVSVAIRSPRVSAAPMEPRAVLAWYDEDAGTYEIRCSNQGGELMAGQLATLLGVPRERVRVHMVDVGGGFGPRAAPYPEYAILLAAARRLGRPVKWLGTRTEDFLSDSHGRGIRLEGELGLTDDGRMLALRTEWLCDQGAYLTGAGPLTNTLNGRLIGSGPYRVEALYGRHRLVLTHTSPTNAYRGASRPEAALLIERLVDEAARRMGLDPVELRRHNAIPRKDLPCRTLTGTLLDSGDFQRLLEVARREADWDGFVQRRQKAEQRGRLLGIGCGLFVEPCGGGFLEHDQVALVFHGDGSATAYIAPTSNGQGHETVFPEIVASRWGIEPQLVSLRGSDPAAAHLAGNGCIGSRSVLAQGSALALAADEAAEKGKRLAAGLLEVATHDLALSAGRYVVRGTDLGVGFREVVRRHAASTNSHPMNTVVSLRNSQAFTSGAHVAEVEIDPQTGETTLVSYIAVDDIGNVMNAVLAHGQIAGGVAQAAGQVFGEVCTYDESSGQLLSASFMDYAMPRAASFPAIQSICAANPSPTNFLGAKGAGETGATGGLATLMNALMSALQRVGVERFDMPASPARVWQVLQQTGTRP